MLKRYIGIFVAVALFSCAPSTPDKPHAKIGAQSDIGIDGHKLIDDLIAQMTLEEKNRANDIVHRQLDRDGRG